MKKEQLKNLLLQLQHNKKRTIIGAVVILLVIAGLIGYALWSQRDKRTPEQKVSDITAQADKKVAEGDVDGALNVLDQSIKQEGNKEVKNGLLMQKSAVAINNDRGQTALDAALEANKIESTYSSTSLVAQIYDQQGNGAKAIEYYKKALEQLDENADPGAGTDRAYFQRRIQALEGGQQ
ncbi:hypothetical protein CYG49_03880 [Candidatus Saccharibacteria bacterium]|nr:MAG: hypothetical protein CYG49_03880 [Candidatus Saccharibacteria bacterium]